MKILLIGDPHFKIHNLDVMSKVCTEILEIIDDKRPDLVINLGDTLDQHEKLYLPALCAATTFLKQIAKRCPLIVLIGNHDRVNNSVFQSEDSPFIGLKEYPNITIADTTIWDKKRNFIYVPYVAVGRFTEALATAGYNPFMKNEQGDLVPNLDQEHPYFLFTHQEFRGCIMGAKISDNGDLWHNDLSQIFGGHIHEHQLLPRICYVGTPIQSNFGESTDKAIMMLYIDEDEKGKIIVDDPEAKVQRPKFLVERIRLKSAPIRTTIHMKLEDLPNFHTLIPAGCMVKVVIHVDATETDGLEKNPQYQALKSVVDKIVIKVESNKASIAEQLVKGLQNTGALAKEKKVYRVEEIVTAMLNDDAPSLEIFQKEIM